MMESLLRSVGVSMMVIVPSFSSRLCGWALMRSFRIRKNTETWLTSAIGTLMMKHQRQDAWDKLASAILSTGLNDQDLTLVR